jgi:hypothetical protein
MRCTLFCVCLLLFASPGQADLCTGIQVDCALNDLGSERYEYVFVITNGSEETNGIFFWVLNPGNAPGQWETVEWVLPDGWTASHPGPQLHFFATNNGSGNPWRVYSPTASSCGNVVYEFRWIFDRTGGPMPTCEFTVADFTFHLQGVGPGMCENIGPSLVCPEPVAVTNASWGAIKGSFGPDD